MRIALLPGHAQEKESGARGNGCEGGYNLLVAALVALLVPACGGGGEGEPDYYVSVRQFENGAKQFRIIASSDVIVSNASGGYGDDRHQAMEGFMKEIEANGVRKDLPFDPDKEHTSTVVPGVCDMGGTRRMLPLLTG